MLLFTGMQIAVAKPDKSENGQNIGVKRRPDTLHDSDGVLHKVWQEPVDGIYQVFYAKQGEEKEMGLGTDKNPSVQLSDSPYHSLRPRIALDSASDIIYVIWTEYIPWEDDNFVNEPMPLPSLFYTAADSSGDNDDSDEWSEPDGFADGRYGMQSFEVYESKYVIDKKIDRYDLDGIMDTDKDGIKDSAEVLGELGYQTDWRKPDTDIDGMNDLDEIEYGFDPLNDDRYGLKAKEFYKMLFRNSDMDGDGLTMGEENDGGFPVTAGAAKVLDDGHVKYRFYPRDDHEAYLILGLQLRRTGLNEPNPQPETGFYSIDILVESEELNDVELSGSGSEMEQEVFMVEIGPFNVAEDAATDVTIEVELTQFPSDEDKYKKVVGDWKPPSTVWIKSLVFLSVMIAAPSPDYNIFNYKEGREFIGAESSKATELREDFLITSDPNRRDLFIEFDYLEGHGVPPALFTEAISAYSDAGIIFHYLVDDENIPLDTMTDPDPDGNGAESLMGKDEARDLLMCFRNPALMSYIHVIFATSLFSEDSMGWIGGCAISAHTAGDLLFELRLLVFIHELGHTIEASHEKPDGLYNALVDGPGGVDTMNEYNAMRSGGVGDVDEADHVLRGVDNDDRNIGATDLIGKPRFSIESADQFNLKNKLSVDTGRNIELLDNYV
jgi:hypothetical protein